MKKFISLSLCLLLVIVSLVGCKTQETPKKETEDKNFTPTKLNISALYDITACSLSYLMEQNTESNLKGTYAVSLYKDDKTFLESDEFMFGLGFTTISSGVKLCKTKDYARMLSLISLNIDAFSKNEIKNLKGFEGKKVLVYDDSDLSENLNIMLKKGSVKCDVTKISDLYEFTVKVKTNKYDIVVATYPAASEVNNSSKKYKHKLSLNDEWDRLKLKGKPYSHCIVASSEVISEEFKTCELFFEEFNTSIEKMNSGDNGVVQSLAARYLNTSNNTALATCKQNGFALEDYNDTEKILKQYAKVRNDGGESLAIDHIIYSF